MKPSNYNKFKQFNDDNDDFSHSLPSSIPNSPKSISDNAIDNNTEIDSLNNMFSDKINSSPELTLSDHHDVITVDADNPIIDVEHTNIEPNPIVLSEEEHDDPHKVDYYKSKIDVCSICKKKKYYYDLMQTLGNRRNKDFSKLCLNCALENNFEKRMLRDIEFKCSRKRMIKPYKCKKCHTYRSCFRFKLNKQNQLQYCSFCAKMKYYNTYKKSLRHSDYVSLLEKTLGDPEKRYFNYYHIKI